MVEPLFYKEINWYYQYHVYKNITRKNFIEGGDDLCCGLKHKLLLAKNYTVIHSYKIFSNRKFQVLLNVKYQVPNKKFCYAKADVLSFLLN